MTIREEVTKKLKSLKERLDDKEFRQAVKEEVRKRLDEGLEMIDKIERELNSPENRKKAEEKIKEAKAKLAQLKEKFKEKRRQAVDYTQKNPQKALLVAAAAGALAGTVWAALRRRK